MVGWAQLQIVEGLWGVDWDLDAPGGDGDQDRWGVFEVREVELEGEGEVADVLRGELYWDAKLAVAVDLSSFIER